MPFSGGEGEPTPVGTTMKVVTLLAHSIDDVLHDPARLAAVRRTGLLDSPAEEPFDRLTRLAAKLLKVPVTFISLLDADRDFYKSASGFPEPLASGRQLEGRTFCHLTLASRDPLVIDDTHARSRPPRGAHRPDARRAGLRGRAPGDRRGPGARELLRDRLRSPAMDAPGHRGAVRALAFRDERDRAARGAPAVGREPPSRPRVRARPRGRAGHGGPRPAQPAPHPRPVGGGAGEPAGPGRARARLRAHAESDGEHGCAGRGPARLLQHALEAGDAPARPHRSERHGPRRGRDVHSAGGASGRRDQGLRGAGAARHPGGLRADPARVLQPDRERAQGEQLRRRDRRVGGEGRSGRRRLLRRRPRPGASRPRTSSASSIRSGRRTRRTGAASGSAWPS